MTPNQKRIFDAVNACLWDGISDRRYKPQYLCYAAQDAYEGDAISFKEYVTLKGVICLRLGKFERLDDWAHYQGFHGSDIEFQAYRKRWLEALVIELF